MLWKRVDCCFVVFFRSTSGGNKRKEGGVRRALAGHWLFLFLFSFFEFIILNVGFCFQPLIVEGDDCFCVVANNPPNTIEEEGFVGGVVCHILAEGSDEGDVLFG